MNNPPLQLRVTPSAGADIGECFDHALPIAHTLNVVVIFDFNEVFCGVRPCDVGERDAREIFVRNYQREVVKKHGCKICYANP